MIVGSDLALLRRDPTFAVTMVVMPLIVMLFMKNAFQATLIADGYPAATGVEQAVPGAVVMFGFFLVANVAFGVFREHTWRTWPRLLAAPMTGPQVLAAKATTPVLLLLTQVSMLFVVGVVFLGLRFERSWLEVAAVSLAYVFCLATLGLMLLALCNSFLQISAISNMGAVVFAGLGGAIAPLSTLPDGVRKVSTITPTYWAMQGLRTGILGGDGSDVLRSVLVLVCMGTLFALIAVWRLRFADPKSDLQ